MCVEYMADPAPLRSSNFAKAMVDKSELRGPRKELLNSRSVDVVYLFWRIRPVLRSLRRTTQGLGGSKRLRVVIVGVEIFWRHREDAVRTFKGGFGRGAG